MTPKDFHIGLEFWCGNKRWRCTDVGSRVVVAISLEPHEVVAIETNRDDPSVRVETRSMTEDPCWMVGPPFAVAENVFDEDSLEVCTLSQDQ